VYVSWNGATEVASWALHTGNSMHLLAQSTIKNRTAFEETFDLPAGQRAAFVQLVGLDGMWHLHANYVQQLSMTQRKVACWVSRRC
jgi:hypothetical protein